MDIKELNKIKSKIKKKAKQTIESETFYIAKHKLSYDVHHERENNIFRAICKEFDLISGHGKTRKDAITEAQKAAAFSIQLEIEEEGLN